MINRYYVEMYVDAPAADKEQIGNAVEAALKDRFGNPYVAEVVESRLDIPTWAPERKVVGCTAGLDTP